MREIYDHGGILTLKRLEKAVIQPGVKLSSTLKIIFSTVGNLHM